MESDPLFPDAMPLDEATFRNVLGWNWVQGVLRLADIDDGEPKKGSAAHVG